MTVCWPAEGREIPSEARSFARADLRRSSFSMDNLSERVEGLSPARRALLELRLRKSAALETQAAKIGSRPNRDSAVLSFAQERLWLLDQLGEQRALYNVPRALRLHGKLNGDALLHALNEIVRRHEVFRTSFRNDSGTLRQVISDELQISMPLTDLSGEPLEHREASAKRLAQREAALPFDLSKGPMIRAGLLRLAEQDHVLLLTTHHIVSDAWSAGLLFKEMGELYNSFPDAQPAGLLQLPIQYADYAEWQRGWLQGDELKRQLSYWRDELAGADAVLELPTDHPRSNVQTASGAYQHLTLSRELSEGLRQLSKQEGATLFMTLLAAFQILLGRYSGQDEIVVGSPIAGRNRTEIEGLIGFFINTLVLRTSLKGEPGFREFLGRVKNSALGAYAHQDLPFEKLVAELQPERDLGRNPLFQVMFQFQNTANAELELNDLVVAPLDVSTETAKFDLMLAAREENGQVVCVIEYSSELFAGKTIERMLEQYATLLVAVVASPDEQISKLSLMTESERRQLSHEWNATAVEFAELKAGPGIHQLFAQQAAQTPSAVALICSGEHLTYGELNRRANQLGRYLRRKGAGPETRIAICLERSLDMIVSLLAVLKAGAAYVPLEPGHPLERRSFILDDSRSSMILTQSNLGQCLPECNASVLALDELQSELDAESGEDFDSGTTVANAAHVLYTSGSTGRPKGVISSHAASLNRFAWMWHAYPFSKGEVCCQKTSLSFVDSIWEVFGPLLRGVPLLIVPREVVKDPQLLLATLAQNKVSRLVLVPSLLRVILEAAGQSQPQLSNLRYCVCSGETLSRQLAASFRKTLPATTLINLYGSSEVAADVTCYEVNGSEGLNEIPIGRPIANTQAYVLDHKLQLAAVGVPGEIFVGGEGLARGYLERADLTAERFLPNPFGHGERLFRTGDLGRYLADGNIEYRGRRDHQVKIRGFRIELAEIETALTAHSQVRETVVIARTDVHGEKQLVAYVVANDQTGVEELRRHLRAKLPEYMMPALFVMLDELPLTPSGKLDRLALPEPGKAFDREDFVAPRTPTEDVLAGIWREVLDVDQVGIHDDFFSLGGHSLLLTRIASRIRDTFAIELSLRSLFEAATVAQSAELIEKALRLSGQNESLPLMAGSRGHELPLSFAQERLWFFDQLEPGSAAYNIPRALRLKGQLDHSALQRSAAAIFARHEVLRTRFGSLDGRPVLSVADQLAVEIPIIAINQLPVAVRDEKVKQLVAAETSKPFDLSRRPLLRLLLLQLTSEEHILVMTMHHIVSDGWSIGLVLGELVSGYNALVSGSKANLPPLPIQYADYAAWQRDNLERAGFKRQLEYWRAQLEGAPALINLPTDRPRLAPRSFQGARHPVRIAGEIVAGLKEIGRRGHATLFMTLLAGFQMTLACLTGDEDIVVGSPTAGRNRAEVEDLIGYFVNTLVLRTSLAGEPTFRNALERVRETALGAYVNQDVPLEKLLEELKLPRSLEFNPLFQVWFVLQNAPGEQQSWHELTAEPVEIESTSTRHDLQLTLWETPGGLAGAFTYSTDLFAAETVALINEQFVNLLQAVVSDSEIRLSELKAKLDETANAHRLRVNRLLEKTSRQTLKSAKRKAVSDRT